MRCQQTYRDECAKLWDREALRNALANWILFQRHHANLVAILRPYLADSMVPDLAGTYQNPEGTLTAWLWKCSAAPENSWIWDFCEHYQKCHLSRGLIIYCKMLIAELKATEPDPSSLLLKTEH